MISSLRHLFLAIPFISILIFVLSIIVAYLSFTQQPSEAFVFPRVISVIFVFLSFVNLAQSIFLRVSCDSDSGLGISFLQLRNMFLGLLIMLLYVFWGSWFLGFYVSSGVCFFLLYSLYDSSGLFSFFDIFKRLLITLSFMCIIYGLFALVLRVQTPLGVFF